MKILFILLFSSLSLGAGEAIKIGASQCSTATAYNNARKIVRTLHDRRIVVYQDKIDDRDAVMLSFSDDGKQWTPPFLFDFGLSPAIAVSATDSVYLLWYAADDSSLSLACFPAHELPDIKNAVAGKLIITKNDDANFGAQAASMDVDESFVQIVMQDGQSDATFAVSYFPLWRTLRRIKNLAHPLLLISGDATPPTPVVATDLDYQQGFVDIVYAYAKTDDPVLMHQSIPLHQFVGADGFNADAFTEYVSDINPPRKLPSTAGCCNPSISVRNDMPGSQTLVGAWHKNRDEMQTCNAWFIYDGVTPRDFIYDQKAYAVNGPCFPSVDDIYFPAVSCAVVWQHGMGIEYGQTDGCRITTNPFVNVAAQGDARFPSVCYKTFRPDSFDVVWTQGAQPPFQVMYRRMQKLYDPEIFMPIDLPRISLPDGVEQQPYHADLHAHGSYYGTSCAVVRGRLPNGLSAGADNDGELVISGVPAQAGDFSFTLQAGPRLPYFIPTFSDTQSYALIIRTATAVHKMQEDAPLLPRIISIRPNPFNAEMRLGFTMPKAARAQVSVYDLSGRKVADLLDDTLPAGAHALRWNAKDFPSGAYLLRLQVNNYSMIKKCLLLK